MGMVTLGLLFVCYGSGSDGGFLSDVGFRV